MKSIFILLIMCAECLGVVLSPAWVESASEIKVDDVYPAPTLYCSQVASGTGDGRSWANAVTNIAQALTTATNGEVIVIDGYNGGLDYGAFDTTTAAYKKQVYIYGSTEGGHNGIVRFIGRHKFQQATNGGWSTIANVEMFGNDSSSLFYGLWNFHKINFKYFGHRTTSYLTVSGPNVFTRCRFGWFGQSSGWSHTTTSTNVWNYCFFDNMSGGWTFSSFTDYLYFNNCTWHKPLADTGYVLVGKADTRMFFTNCVIIGNYPVNTATNVIVESSYYTYPSYVGTPASTNWCRVVGTTTVYSHLLTNAMPMVDAYPGPGRLFLRMDDNMNISNALRCATVLNPEHKINLCINGHSGTDYVLSSNNVADLRALINAGNGIAAHGSTHAQTSLTNLINIVSSGTDPRCWIETTNSGDSTTWSGRMYVAVGTEGVDRATNELNLTGKTIGNVITNYQLLSLGDGQVKATNSTAAKSVIVPACLLTNVANLDISTLQFLKFSDPAEGQFEIVENVQDLQAYIRTGSDRNGANTVTTDGATGQAATYDLNIAASAAGTVSSLALQYLTNITLGSWKVDPASSIADGDEVFKTGNPVYIYGFLQNDTPSHDGIIDSLVLHVKTSHAWKTYLNHTNLQYAGTGNAGVTNLKNFLLAQNVRCVTFHEAVTNMLSDASYMRSNTTIVCFTNEFSTRQQHVKLDVYSRCLNAGASTSNTIDLNGFRVPRRGSVDIGAFELQ